MSEPEILWEWESFYKEQMVVLEDGTMFKNGTSTGHEEMCGYQIARLARRVQRLEGAARKALAHGALPKYVQAELEAALEDRDEPA